MQNIFTKLKIALSLMLFVIVSQFTTVEARTNSVSSNNGSSNLNGLYPVILSEEEDDDEDDNDDDGCSTNDDEDEDHDGNDEDEEHDGDDEDEDHDGDDEDEDHDGDDEDEEHDGDDDCSNSCDKEDNNGNKHDGDDNEDDHNGDGDGDGEDEGGDNKDDDHNGDDEDEDHEGDEDNGHCTGNNPPPPPPAPVLHDLGDAPASYGQASHVLLANNNPFLGVIAPDADVAPQVSIDATADDSPITGIDDEGGSIFVSSARGYFELCGFTVNTESIINIKVNTTGVANLNGWIDWNADGVFAANEQIFTDVASLGGSVMTSLTVPFNAIAGTSFVRIRYSTDIGVSPNGVATDGEVEDCSFTILATPPPPPPTGKGGKLPPPPPGGGI